MIFCDAGSCFAELSNFKEKKNISKSFCLFVFTQIQALLRHTASVPDANIALPGGFLHLHIPVKRILYVPIAIFIRKCI